MADASEVVQSPRRSGRFWVRPATQDDALIMLAIIRQAYVEYSGKLDPPSGAFRESETKIRELLMREHGVVAGIGDRAAGCVFYHPDGTDVYFHRLAVLPDYRQMAIGRALISYIEARARENGSQRVRLGVRLAIPSNLALYANLGYTVEGYGSHTGYIEPTYARMIKPVAEPAERIIEVVPPDPEWPRRFREEAVMIQLILGDNLVAIHHVGSTAIPGIYAKPVIDLMPVVRALDAVDACNDLMLALGYMPRGEAEIPGRRYFAKGQNLRLSQVHAYTADNPEVARHLKFRDYLIAHPDRAKVYGDLKRELAQRFPHDIYGYMDGKDALIKQLLDEAFEWQPG